VESIKIKRKARTIPFGFKQSEDPDYLEPIKEELDALRQAREYSKTCSLRETAQWLHRKTGRYISHVGLKKRLERSSRNFLQLQKEKYFMVEQEAVVNHMRC
jgi:hypothetical protein